MSVRTPTWLEDPARLLRLVAPFLDGDVPAPSTVRAQVRAEREAQVAGWCADCSDETAVAHFREQLAYARKAMAVLEEHNHWIDQASSGQLRLAVMAAARWLVAKGILREAEEVFWLTYAEIGDALRSGTLAEGLISDRQAAYARWETLTPPPFLGMPEAMLPPRPEMAEVPATEEGGEEGALRGLGASPGMAQGPVRVLPNAAVAVDCRPGDILVAANAGPLWTPFFPILGGIILEEGSLGQHAAVTAREYGIPAIINVRQATRELSDGEWVAIDGQRGVISRLPEGGRA